MYDSKYFGVWGEFPTNGSIIEIASNQRRILYTEKWCAPTKPLKSDHFPFSNKEMDAIFELSSPFCIDIGGVFFSLRL